MSIEAVFERIAVALERIADGGPVALVPVPTAVPATPAAAPESTSQAAEGKKKPGRPRKVAEAAASPAVAPEAPATTSTVVVTPETPQPPTAPAPAPEADDDFLGTEAPKKDYAIEDVRAALVAYAGASSQQVARAALKELSGFDALSQFTDKTKYADFIEKIEKRTAAAKA